MGSGRWGALEAGKLQVCDRGEGGGLSQSDKQGDMSHVDVSHSMPPPLPTVSLVAGLPLQERNSGRLLGWSHLGWGARWRDGTGTQCRISSPAALPSFDSLEPFFVVVDTGFVIALFTLIAFPSLKWRGHHAEDVEWAGR